MIVNAGLDRMRWRKPVAGLVEDQTGQDAGRAEVLRCAACNGVVGQECLNRVPGLAIDDCLMQSGIGLTFVGNLADVDGIGQQLVEVPARERLATLNPATCEGSPFGHDPLMRPRLL